MSGATKSASIGMLVIKGRLGKMWALSGRKQETWLPKTWIKLRYSITFLSRSLLESASATRFKKVERVFLQGSEVIERGMDFN